MKVSPIKLKLEISQENACGIETLHTIRDHFPEKIRILLLNAFVLRQHQNPSILLKEIT